MIQMHVSMTARTPHPSSEWTIYHEYSKQFPDMASARDYLSDEYYYCKKRKPIYQDTKSRGTVQCGWCYCFKTREEGKVHYEQHWVSFHDVSARVIDVKAKV
jgi:hypothetical protein